MIPTPPLMIYDGNCTFCIRWIERWQKITKNRIYCAPYQEIIQYFPQLNELQCEEAVQFVDEDGKVYPAAAAIFKSLHTANCLPWFYKLYQSQPLFAKISEFIYRWVARNRGALSKLGS